MVTLHCSGGRLWMQHDLEDILDRGGCFTELEPDGVGLCFADTERERTWTGKGIVRARDAEQKPWQRMACK